MTIDTKFKLKVAIAYAIIAISFVAILKGVDAQDKKSEQPVSANPTPTPTVAVLSTPITAPGTVGVKAKSYPLPAPLGEAIDRLVSDRTLAERALLNYIADPKIYVSEDDTVRAAFFDRQARLFKQLTTAIEAERAWVEKQRKEFNCATCEGRKGADGNWTFQEPEPQGGVK